MDLLTLKVSTVNLECDRLSATILRDGGLRQRLIMGNWTGQMFIHLCGLGGDYLLFTFTWLCAATECHGVQWGCEGLRLGVGLLGSRGLLLIPR
jgi:hypothetical protein